MQDKRYVICGNAPADGFEENPDRDLRLRLWGNDGPDKITLRIEDIHKKMCKDVPDAFQDLLEIATYIYSADQAPAEEPMTLILLVMAGAGICTSSSRCEIQAFGVEPKSSRHCDPHWASCQTTTTTSNSLNRRRLIHSRATSISMMTEDSLVTLSRL